MMSELLVIKNIRKYFKVKNGWLHAVDDVSFSLDKGKTIGIVGRSGCGKSTLGRTILRLEEPTSGEVFFKGKDIVKLSQNDLREMRSHMQIIFQDPYASLNPRMCIKDLIAAPMRVNGSFSKNDIEKRVAELMDTVGLASRLTLAYPHELDGGRRQRVGVARALALNPEFIVCDEPVSALDVSIQAQILNLLVDLKKERNLAYMFITHDLSVVKHISNEIAVMYLGRIVERAESKELFGHPIHPYTKALLSAIPKPDISTRNKKIELIRGEVSSPINPSPGCRFAPRCPFCTKECTASDESSKLIEVSRNHFVACPIMAKEK